MPLRGLTQFGALLLVVAAPMRGQARPAAPPLLEPPADIGAYHVTKRHTFADPSAGIMARYEAPSGMTADVFVFPIATLVGAARAPTATAKEILAVATQTQHAAFDTLVAHGDWDRYVVAYEEDASRVVDSATVVPGTLTVVTVSNGGDSLVSLAYCYVLRGHLVKVRITVPVSEFDGAQPMTDFVTAMVPALIRQ